jgi:hypothetical protein
MFFVWGLIVLLGAVVAVGRHETELVIVSVVAGLTMIGAGIFFRRRT